MLRWLLRRMVAAGERQVGVKLDYTAFLIEKAPWRLMRFALIRSVEGRRRVTPPAAYHAAGLAAAMAEDCGPCVQIHVNLALKDGVEAGVLKALTEGRLKDAPQYVALAFQFGDAVARGEMAEPLRDEIKAEWGDEGLIELAFTIAVARFYPGLKRGLGYAQACERVVIEGHAGVVPKAA